MEQIGGARKIKQCGEFINYLLMEGWRKKQLLGILLEKLTTPHENFDVIRFRENF